jgi:hypothetical protein
MTPLCLLCADLKVLGGLDPLVTLLQDSSAPSLQAGAAYVLGTAVSNNEKLAADVIKQHPQILQQLLKVGGESQVQYTARWVGHAGPGCALLLVLLPGCVAHVRRS